MKRIAKLTFWLFILFGSTAIAQVGLKTSQYPRITTPQSGYLVLWANPGATNYAQQYSDLKSGIIAGITNLWTNALSSGDSILENVDQTSNLAMLEFANGNVVFSTFGAPFPAFTGFGNIIIGNTYPANGALSDGTIIGDEAGHLLSNSTNVTVIGGAALNAADQANNTTAVGWNAGGQDTNDFGSVFIGNMTGPDFPDGTTNCIFIGTGAGTDVANPTNTIVIAPNTTATSDNVLILGNANQNVIIPGLIANLNVQNFYPTNVFLGTNWPPAAPLTYGETFFWNSNGTHYDVNSKVTALAWTKTNLISSP